MTYEYTEYDPPISVIVWCSHNERLTAIVDAITYDLEDGSLILRYEEKIIHVFASGYWQRIDYFYFDREQE